MARSHIHGVGTNRRLLVNVLRHPVFLAGHTDTAFFDTHGVAALAAAPTPTPACPPWRPRSPTPPTTGAPQRRSDRPRAVGATCPPGITPGTTSTRRAPSTRCATATPATPWTYPTSGHHRGLGASRRVVLSVAGAERTFAVARHGDEVFVDSPLGRPD
jgi:hypothetical protein